VSRTGVQGGVAEQPREGSSLMDRLGSTKEAAVLHRLGLRSAVLLLAAILMAGTLTACDDGSEAGGETESDTTTTN
jgi:hypothetical protein